MTLTTSQKHWLGSRLQEPLVVTLQDDEAGRGGAGRGAAHSALAATDATRRGGAVVVGQWVGEREAIKALIETQN